MTVKEFIRRIGRPYVYHFTDLENLPLIRKHGLLAYSELVSRDIVPPKPGGNDWSRDADQRKGLDTYVHLCLTDNHPMEYRAKESKHIGATRFLRISTDILMEKGVMGCSKVSNSRDAGIIPLEEALDLMDLKILFGGRVDFTNKKLQARFNEAKKSEILVPRHVSVSNILNLS